MKYKKTKILFSVLFVIFLFTSFFDFAFANFNKQINYQGKLRSAVDNTIVPNGDYNIEIDLYTVASGGSPVWTETRTLTDRVVIRDGLFSILLGDITPLTNVDFNQDLYLAVTIGSTTTSPTWDTEMTPRKKFGAVPASILSGQVIGEGRSSIGTTSPIENVSLTIEATSTNSIATVIRGFAGQIADLFRIISNTGSQLLTFTSGGNLGIGTSSPYAKLSVVGDIVTDRIIATSTTATSTFAWGLQANALNITSTTATSTFANGIALTGGCFSVDGVCLGTGGTADGTWSTTSANYWSSIGLGFSTTSSNYWLTQNLGNSWSTTSANYYIHSSTTIPTMYKANTWTGLNIFNNASSSLFTVSGNSWLGTTTMTNFSVTNTSTSTIAGNLNVQGILQVGTGSIYLRDTATSTFANGIDVANGCFSIGGVCLGGGSGSGTVLASTLQGQLPFYNGIGTTLTATSSIFLAQNGYVGIGTTSPTDLLTISGNASSWTGITGMQFSDKNTSVTSRNWGIYTNAFISGGLAFSVGSAQGVTSSNGTVVMTLSKEGNVGIGTTTPNQKLSIFNNTADSAVEFSSLSGAKYKWTMGMDYSDGGKFKIASSSTLGTASTDRFVIDGNGNVGIGTTSPLRKLEVTDNSNWITSLFSGSNTAGVGLKFAPSGTGGADWFIMASANGAAQGGGKLGFLDSNATTRMVIDNNGNVGIGTTSPYAKLSVVGQIVASYYTATSTTATSTFANGIALSGGCFSVDGVCLGIGGTADGTWSTTSANYWSSIGLGFSTTSSNYWLTQNTGNAFSTTSADNYMNASATIPTMYKANTWTALNIFGNASTSALTVTNNSWLGTTTMTNLSVTNTNTSTFSGLVNVNGTGTSTISSNLNVQGQLQIGTGSVHITNNTISLATPNSYLNFGSQSGLSGYGIRENNGTLQFKDNGGSWADFSSLNSTTQAGLNEGGWVDTGSDLPTVRDVSQIETIGDYIYLFGGSVTGGAATSTIVRAPTSDPLSWSYAGILPGNLFGSQSAVIGNYVYLFGGNTGSEVTNVIYRAPTSDPTNWIDTGSTIPGVLQFSKVAVIGDYVYLFGGHNGSISVDSIYRAPVSDPTSWVNTGGTLPMGLHGLQLATIGDYVYIFGGLIGSSKDVIYRAPVSDPTSWTDTGNTLPSILYLSELQIIGDYIYLFGGWISDVTNVIYRAPVSSPTSWSNTGYTLPENLHVSQSLIVGDYVYLFGGNTGSNDSYITSNIYRAPISPSNTFAGLSIFDNASTTLFTVASNAWMGTTSVTNLAVTNTSTSTFAGGLNIVGGCISVGGVCLGGGGSGIVNSGTIGQISYYEANGTTVSGTSTLMVSTNSNIGIGTTSPQTKLSVYGDIFVEGSNRYLNFGTTTGTLGYGLRDVNGTLQIKNSYGDWVAFSSTTPSLGVSQNDVTVSRTLNTVYQNNTGKPLYVSIRSHANGGAGSIFAYSDSINPPTTSVSAQAGGDGWARSIFFIVAPGNYYKVTYDTATTLEKWIEWTLDGALGEWATSSADYWITASTTIPKTTVANTWTALNVFDNASTSALTVTNNSYLGTTTMTNLTVTNTNTSTFSGLINVSGIGTSTLAGNLNVQGVLQVGTGSIYLTDSATSTFTYGIQAPTLNITSTTATSTFANGINLTGGCFAVNGVCQTSSSGIYATTSNSGVLGTASFNSSGESVANLITSGNISDITKDPEPNWVVTFTNPEPNTNYNPVIKVSNEPGQPEGRIKNGTKTVNGFSFYITRADNGAFAYPTIVEVSILRYTPSIPLGASQNDVTGSRLMGTVYQNNTGKPLFVSVASRSNSGAGSSNAYSDSSVSPTKIVAAASGAEGFNRQITFVVIPGDYYKVTVDSASTVEQWIEWTLDGGGVIVNNSWSTTSADNYMNASATVPTMYKANIWTALNIFNNASTSALTVTNNSWLGTTTISNLAVTNTNTSTFGGLINVNGTGTSTISSNLNVQGTLQVGTGSLYLTGSGISSTDGSVSIGTTGTTTFGTNGFNVGTNALIIQQTSGNIGIGTTTINEKLTVDGSLSLAELAEVDIPGATTGFGKLYASLSTGFGGGIGGNDTFTKFLLPADGSGATFVDSSLVPKSITAYGDATQSATQSKFGGKSAYFDGTGDYLTTPNSDDFRFRTGDFSVDWWMYCGTDWASMDSAGVVGQKETDPSSGWVIYKNNVIDPTSVNIRIDGTNDYSSNAQPTTATWEHWAVTRQSGTLRWFKNGTLTATHTVNADINDTSGLLMIGRSQVWSGHFNGYIDELRITKGIARWTSDFTPPASAYDTTSLADSTNLFFKSSLGGLVNLTAWKQNGTSTYYSLGNVGIGTSTLPVSTLSVQGSLCVRDTGSCGTTAGTIYATNASISDIDLAENYPVSDITLEAGDLVSLDTSTSTTIKKANGLNKETILGVISTKPGLTLGKEIINGKPVALAGRIPVKVNLENGPIQIGDRISISSIPGVGMKMSATSTQSVGVALESFDGKDLFEQTKFERIVVFVNLSWNKLDTSITEGNVNSSIWTIDETTGFIKSVTAQILDMQGQDIVNVRKIISANGKWSMDENGKLRVKELEADKVKTGEFCMDDICITKDKFKALLINAGIDSATQNSSPLVSGTTSTQIGTTTDILSDTEPPIIILNGNNPANLTKGDLYLDMGAIVTDNIDQNLGYQTSVWQDGVKISDTAEINTETAGTYEIHYNATDNAGNKAIEVMRTVNVTDLNIILETSTSTPDTATTTP